MTNWIGHRVPLAQLGPIQLGAGRTVDTSTADQRRRLSEIRGQTIEACSAAGFDAVEIGNLHS
ncbi:hypothetical protein [Saccharopolyspora spinosa]|uniref:hypothetical protein n=1 Tax=Saccharopolyspora spinosa TaxID=60894 RepID=UPI000237B722|nr:hypothetical protein [Saccharopolyspora spinosa]